MPGPNVPGVTRHRDHTPTPSPPPLADWLLQPATTDAMARWHQLIAPLATVQTPKALWHALEKIGPQLVSSCDAGLYLGVPSNMVPQVMFDRSGFYQRASREELDEEFRNPMVGSMLEANPGIRLMTWRHFAATPDELSATEPFRTYLARRDWNFPLGLFFWQGPRLLGAWVLYRSHATGDFTDAEQALFNSLYTPVHDACLRVLKQSADRTRHQSLQRFTRELPLPYAIASLNGRLLDSNRAGREFLDRWQQDSPAVLGTHAELPDAIHQAVARQAARLNYQLKSELWANGDELTEQVAHPQHPAWQARLTMLPPRLAAPADPVILIQLNDQSRMIADPAHDSITARDQLFANLTLRERELVDAVLQGLSNKEIADLLQKSVPTIKHQLNRVYAKLGIPNRKRLLAMVR